MDTRPLLVQQGNRFGAPKVESPLNAPRIVAPISAPIVHAPLSGQSHFPEPEQYDGNSAADYAAFGVAAVAGVVAGGINAALSAGEFTNSDASSVVAGATWHPQLMMIEIRLHSGRSYEYPCGPAEWVAYDSAPSKGGFLNETWWS
jgi:hypothetical protein